jgi:hypothetical protein
MRDKMHRESNNRDLPRHPSSFGYRQQAFCFGFINTFDYHSLLKQA